MKEENLLAKNLRIFRLRAGYSQSKVADILRMHRSTYTYFEAGKMAPDSLILYKISQIYGVPMESFFEESIA